jgi:general secretion pathway protein L
LVVVGEFLNWWVGQLASLAPRSTSGPIGGKVPILVVTPDLSVQPGPPAVIARIEKRDQIERIGRVVLDPSGLRRLRGACARHGHSLQTWIEMPPGGLLEKRLTMPVVAERELDRVLGYEIDRETPFHRNDIYWARTVEQRDHIHRRITVRVAIVAKRQLGDLPSTLGRAGLVWRGMIGRSPSGATAIIPAARPGEATRRGWRDFVRPALGWACAVLLVAAIAIPFARQEEALSAVNRQIASLRPAVTAVEHLKARIDHDRIQVASLARQRAKFGNPLTMLTAVTAALPDDTHLTELDYSKGNIVLTGLSKRAARLIGDISHSPDLRNPAFSAPVRRIEHVGVDVFSITARERE